MEWCIAAVVCQVWVGSRFQERLRHLEPIVERRIVEVAPPGLVAHVEVAAVGDVLPHALDELGLVAVGHGVEGQEQLARPIVGGGGGGGRA